MSAARFTTYAVSFSALLAVQELKAEEEEAIQKNETMEVIGVTPAHGTGLPKKLIPFNVQSITSKDLKESQTSGLTDFMNYNLGSVTINEAQNNPLQSDIQYRGYTLSPLLGLPQGLTVYQDGVRINEPFGDSMNWDLIPESSIASINLMGGSNPIFGLNTLGGSLSIVTKNGFTHPSHSIETYGGSFGRVVTTVESGGNNGKWGYFFTGNYFSEDGWRDASPSDALNLFGALSYRTTETTLDITYNHANTDLIGNGPLPVELLALDRAAVFTSPDQTRNKLDMINLSSTHWLSDTIQISGNAFYRNNKTNSFNGDGSEYTDCSNNNAGFLCEEDDLAAPIEDQNGNNIAVVNANGSERNAINNISHREQESFGVNIQTTLLGTISGHQNQLIFGSGYQQGLIDFSSSVEIATLDCEFNDTDCTIVDADRSTTGTSLFVVEQGTYIKAHNRIWSLYATDTFSVTDKLAITASARYNNSHIVLGDRSSQTNTARPEDPTALNGEHNFDRINPAFGITYQFNNSHGIYGSYSESSRAPTPIELLCADEDAPCNLPNAFLADPPLEQVITRSVEGGLRGTLRKGIKYYINGFHSTNNNDIIFGSTGGTTSSRGFFRNVGNTQRVGAEIGLSGILMGKFKWFTHYSYVNATFEDAFIGVSANHPNATDLNGDGNADEIQVQTGDRIPGIPKHSIKLGGTYIFNNKFSLGINMIYNSNQVLRGDENNELDPVDAYVVVNLHSTYKINEAVSVFARINNLFDTDYETFGLLGDGSEIFDGSGATHAFSNPKFLGVGAPISGFFGVTITF